MKHFTYIESGPGDMSVLLTIALPANDPAMVLSA